MKKHEGDPPACVECSHFGCLDADCFSEDCSTFDAVEGRKSVKARDARKSEDSCGWRGKHFKVRQPVSRRVECIARWIFIASIAGPVLYWFFFT